MGPSRGAGGGARRPCRVARDHPRLPRPHAPGPGRLGGRDAARGRDTAAARAAPLRADRVRGAPQDRGREPHGLVQGPRHDRGHDRGPRGRREGRDLRVDGQHLGVGGRLRDARRPDLRRPRAPGQDRARQARPGDGARCSDPAARGQLRRLPGARPPGRRAVPDRAGQLGEPGAHRGAEDRGVRDLRPDGPRAGHPRAARRQRRQHHGLLARLHRVRRRRRRGRHPAHVRRAGRGRRPARARRARDRPGDPGHRHPHRLARVLGRGDRGARRVGGRDHRGGRRRHPRGLPPAGGPRGRVRRAGLGRVGGGAAREVAGRAPRHGPADRRDGDRARAQGPRHRARGRRRARRAPPHVDAVADALGLR